MRIDFNISSGIDGARGNLGIFKHRQPFRPWSSAQDIMHHAKQQIPIGGTVTCAAEAFIFSPFRMAQCCGQPDKFAIIQNANDEFRIRALKHAIRHGHHRIIAGALHQLAGIQP